MASTAHKEGAVIFAPATDQYNKGSLDIDNLESDPNKQFQKWYQDARDANVYLPEAVTLSTARLPSGRVSSRVVLMKEFDDDGSFVLYSNWEASKKAKDVASNPQVSLTFFWKELERQVRVEGIAKRISNEESAIYYHTRPRDSQIGAWASPQSNPVESRAELDDKVEEQARRFKDVDVIPCPPHWGGIKIKPLEWEFFQGRPNRIHDRFLFTRESVDVEKWDVTRIAP